MKLSELKTMGSQGVKIYNSLWKLIIFGYPGNFNGLYYQKGKSLKDLGLEVDGLEIKDVFDLYSEKEILKVKGFGPKSMQTLKELV